MKVPSRLLNAYSQSSLRPNWTRLAAGKQAAPTKDPEASDAAKLSISEEARQLAAQSSQTGKEGRAPQSDGSAYPEPVTQNELSTGPLALDELL